MTQKINQANMHDQAADRLIALELSLDLLDDASGQAAGDEHWNWLATAPEAEIRQWVADMADQPAADAYWLNGTAYCPECVEGDTPCLGDEEIARATRSPGQGQCGCCHVGF